MMLAKIPRMMLYMMKTLKMMMIRNFELINSYFTPAAFKATNHNGEVSNLSQAYPPLSRCEGEQILQ